MKSLLFFLTTCISLNSFADSTVFISPISVGVMNSLRSSGEPGADSTLTFGAEALFNRNQLLFGLKYDHIENSWEGDSIVGVRNKMDIALLQVGYKLLSGTVSPYIFTGGGAFFQTVYSRMFNEEEANSTIMFGYKLGLGVLCKFSNSWGASLSMSYYPQSFVNSFNYVLSAGFVL